MERDDQSKRTKKLKLAFKKAITETFKDRDALRGMLLAHKPPRDEVLSFVNDPDASAEENHDEHNHAAVENLLESLRQQCYDTFKSKLGEYNVVEKLENLEKMIRENRVNLRDIRSKEYIREIYESNLAESKIELYSTIEEATLKARERKNNVRARNEDLATKLESIRKINEAHEQKFQVLVGKLNAFSK